MSIGDDNDVWSGTMAELAEIVMIGRIYRQYSDNEYPARRVISIFSINYIKRNKQTINFIRNE